MNLGYGIFYYKTDFVSRATGILSKSQLEPARYASLLQPSERIIVLTKAVDSTVDPSCMLHYIEVDRRNTAIYWGSVVAVQKFEIDGNQVLRTLVQLAKKAQKAMVDGSILSLPDASKGNGLLRESRFRESVNPTERVVLLKPFNTELISLVESFANRLSHVDTQELVVSPLSSTVDAFVSRGFTNPDAIPVHPPTQRTSSENRQIAREAGIKETSKYKIAAIISSVIVLVLMLYTIFGSGDEISEVNNNTTTSQNIEINDDFYLNTRSHNINLRRGPSTDYGVVSVLNHGDKVLVEFLDRNTLWAKIKNHAGQEGYISKNLIEATLDKNIEEIYKKGTLYWNKYTPARLYSIPSQDLSNQPNVTSNEPNETEVWVKSKLKNSNWYTVSITRNGETRHGFVPQENLRIP